MRLFIRKIYFAFLIIILYSCGNKPRQEVSETRTPPSIEPDFSNITIPPNIAPLNFLIKEEGTAYLARFSVGSKTAIEIGTGNGVIKIPEKRWKRMLQDNAGQGFNIDIFIMDKNGTWSKYNTISNKVANEPVDPYISYRLLYPGYESWQEISIKQRSLESFHERSIIENSVVDHNCVNCHSYNNGKSDDFLFHMRGSMGGTYFYAGGEFRKTNLKTEEMKNGAVYPRWHPSGKFVAFSSNKIIQQFHATDNKKVEVSDLESYLVLYDVEKNEMMNIELADKEKYMDTYPEWSPDGRYLYFCRAGQVGEVFNYRQIHYNLYRVSFDRATRKFGEAELVFDAAQQNKSISFPRISPDGRFLVLTLHDYGCFPIWHKEADLYSIDLETLKPSKMALNSDLTDSYHSWSSNGKWLVFSSKRIDGLTARFFISYIDENGNSDKPFILPQNDPEFYQRFLKSYNLPEFSTLKIEVNPGRIRKRAEAGPLQAKWSVN